MKTVNTQLKLKNVKEVNVRQLLQHLKEIEDIPYHNVDVHRISSTALELLIQYPLEIFDKTVSQFIAVLFGELAFMRAFGDLRFENLELPEEVMLWFGGPKFGVDEIKKRFNVDEFPLLAAIIKPSLGSSLSIDTIEEKISNALRGGLHGVKDDEMQGNFVKVPLEERIKLAAKYRVYVPTVNKDTVEEFREIVSNKKIGMILVNASTLGFPTLYSLHNISRIPILSHVAMQGTYHASFRPKVFALLHRLFGCDAFVSPIGDVDYYRISKQDEIEMVSEFTKDLPIKKTLPILAGGARLHNLEQIVAPYEEQKIPYGVLFGTLIFASEKSPVEMAQQVVDKIKEIKKK